MLSLIIRVLEQRPLAVSQALHNSCYILVFKLEQCLVRPSVGTCHRLGYLRSEEGTQDSKSLRTDQTSQNLEMVTHLNVFNHPILPNFSIWT